MFLGTTSSYFQALWFRQSDLPLGFMEENAIQTWSAQSISLTKVIGSGMINVIQIDPVMLSPEFFWTVEEKLRSSLYWGCFAF